jgi:PhoPQ-activated pathogenicity-related protein
MVSAVTASAAERNVPGGDKTALDRYVAKADDSYRWVKKDTGKIIGVDYAELILTSQTWRGILWRHQLFVIKPSSTKPDTKHALLFIAGGRWKDALADLANKTRLPREAALFAAIAERMKTPVAILLHVPQQPIFDGKVEDQIIALTFENFLKTGDEEWPLLLPMVKSAVRAMDATQEFTKNEWSLGLETFTVTGASKRGWTTWLTGAADKRATAIAPMVIDMLNMQRHLEYQKSVWGDYSHKINDYTERGIQKHLATESGKALRAIVDPFSYRQRITQPKLMIIGTNDHYWPLDALNLYWDDLVGPKYVLYVPNNRHGLRDYGRVLGTLNALHQQAFNGFQMPKLSWTFKPNGTGLVLSVKSDVRPARVNIWKATAAKRDFRKSKWSSRQIERNGDGYAFELRPPETGYAALFGEAVYEADGVPYYLSTNVRVINSADSVKDGE